MQIKSIRESGNVVHRRAYVHILLYVARKYGEAYFSKSRGLDPLPKPSLLPHSTSHFVVIRRLRRTLF